MNISLVLQGPLYPYTNEIIAAYLKHPLVGEVVVSCWTTCPELGIRDSRIKLLRSEDPKVPGVGNVNRQLVTSLAGVLEASSDYCAKLRTDQWLTAESLTMMDRFFAKFRDPEVRYEDGSGPEANIFVAGMYTRFPFHPRDHIYWGRRKDLLSLLNIPLCSFNTAVPGFTVGTEEYYERVLRPETYVGAYYYAKFESSIFRFIRNPKRYLIDVAAERDEAMNVYERLRDKVFKVFPRIEMSWPKHNLKSYHFHVGERFSEYWYDQPW